MTVNVTIEVRDTDRLLTGISTYNADQIGAAMDWLSDIEYALADEEDERLEASSLEDLEKESDLQPLSSDFSDEVDRLREETPLTEHDLLKQKLGL
jgi:hypothetical protein